jgi:hypothetical protein
MSKVTDVYIVRNNYFLINKNFYTYNLTEMIAQAWYY